ncbi:MAG: diguanylate cyclase [Lachnospiraceae bacterium]|nr:diguanylate cyclase [Lachnospiraceae bacterium]
MANSESEKIESLEAELLSTKQMLSMLLDNIPGGVMEYDAETEKIGYISDGLLNIFGCSEQSFREHFYNSFELFVYKFDRTMVHEQIKNQTMFFDSVELTYRVRGLMDDIIWVYHKGRIYTDSEGKKRFLVVLNDVTNEKLIQAELQRNTEQLYMETERLKLIEEAVDNTEYDYNVLNDTMETSERDREGRRRVIKHFMANSRLGDVIHPEDLETCEELFKECLKTAKKGVMEYRIRPGGSREYVWFRMTYASFTDKQDRVIRVIGSAKDITAEKAEREELETRALLDGMTGLLNKTAMQSSVEKCIAEGDVNSCHAMMMVDTDNFKNVNDTLGHEYGDRVIKYVASCIRDTFRETDYVGRMGGDEFMVFIRNTTRGIAEERASRLNRSIKRVFEDKGKSVGISCSIGIAYFARDGADYDSLFKAADKALYDAKEAGKNCYRTYRL